MPEPHDPLEGLPRDKLQAVLQSLEAERQRRRDEQIAAGKLILLHTTRVVGVVRNERPEVVEAAKAAAIAKQIAQFPADSGKAFEVDVQTIITGVQRAEDRSDQRC